MSTQLPISTRIKSKLVGAAREFTEAPLDRRWRRVWARVDSVEGWLLPAEGRWLFDAARSVPTGANIVEIGSFKGRSTCCLAAGCQDHVRVFAVDSFDGGPNLPNVNSLPEFLKNLTRCGVRASVEPTVGLSGEIAKTWDQPIHLLFIDGSHNYEDVLADFASFFPHVVPGGTVALHDVENEDWPGVGRAWAEINHLLTDVGYCESMGFGRKPLPRSEHYTETYYAAVRNSSIRSAEVIVPLVLRLVPAHSVVDVGCGEGPWLAAFRKNGVLDVLGIDGDYVHRDALQIPQEQFQAADLSKPLEIGRTFDLAVSMEVAEHLPPECAVPFVESLTRLSSVILFSAAIPFQGGNHHVNEQWPDKWAELFKKRGYLAVDCIRRRVWQNDAVDWWYAQNALLFVRSDVLEGNKSLAVELERTNPDQLRLVHPRNYVDALQPFPPPQWNTRTAWQLLLLCLRNGISRRLNAILGRKSTPQNPPNFNSLIQDGTCYGTVRRREPAQDDAELIPIDDGFRKGGPQSPPQRT